MTNHIHEKMTLEDGKKYIVMKQAIYKNENYYVAVRLTEDEQDVKEEYKVFHEILVEGETRVEEVTDLSVFNLVLSYVGLK